MNRFVKFDEYTIREKKVKINISLYDTSGQERYEAIVINFFQKCDGELLVYSIDDKNSFNGLSKWINKNREYNKKFPIF